MDPYSSPADGGEALGGISLTDALATGASAMLRNLISLIGTSLVLFLAYMASCCTLVGWIAVVPWLAMGYFQWALDAVDGKASLFTCFRRVADDPVTMLLRAWGIGLMMLVVGLPAGVIGASLGVLTLNATPEEAAAYALGLQIPTIVYYALIARFNLAMFYVAERRTPAVEAMTGSWKDTAGSWIPLAVIVVLMQAMLTPGNVAIQYASKWMEQGALGNPDELLAMMGPMYGGLMLVSAFNALVGAYVFLVYAAAYRQLYPDAPAETI